MSELIHEQDYWIKRAGRAEKYIQIQSQSIEDLRVDLARRDDLIKRLVALGDALIANEAVFASQEQAEHYTVVINEWEELKGMAR